MKTEEAVNEAIKKIDTELKMQLNLYLKEISDINEKIASAFIDANEKKKILLMESIEINKRD